MSSLSYASLSEFFKESADVVFQRMLISKEQLYVMTCESMIDEKMLYEVVIKTIESKKTEDWGQFIQQSTLPQLQEVTTLEQAEQLLFNGFCLLLLERQQLTFAVNIANKPNRKPEETRLEVQVKGPRDNFIEHLQTNIALVRKRLPTHSLAVKKYNVGVRSQTAVAIVYFQDIANDKLVAEIEQQIQEIDTDVVISGELLMEMVNKRSFIFPRYEYSGRPDFVVQSLVRGRVGILVDGTAYAIITPVNFFLLLKSGEDAEYPAFYTSFQRFLRIIGMGFGLLLPAFWLALTTFHQNQIPFQLLATIVLAKTGLPFPSALEMLIMILFFELFREAGLRLPSVIGGTISVVGGLIIGDAAISSGVTSPAMVVVIAISTIASFTLGNQSVIATVSILRLVFIIVTSFLGLYGFFLCIFVTLAYMTSIKVFGVSYLNVSTDLTLKNFIESFFRLRHQQYSKRPPMLKPKDKTRKRPKQ